MATTEAAERKSVLSTVFLLFGVAIVVGSLLAIYGALGVSVGMTAFGSLFLLYWAGLQHQSWAQFLPSLVGGLLGIALAWLLLAGSRLWGLPGVVAGFAVLAVTLFFYLRGEARAVVNNGTMLILLVATIPELRVQDNAPVMAESLVIGAGYIGIITFVAARLRDWWAGRSLQS